MLDSLIVSLFGENIVYRKKAFWTLFGDDIYENVKRNISNSFVQCQKCKKRFMRTNQKQICCDKCNKLLEKKGLKIYRCEDCGKLEEIPKDARRPARCEQCGRTHNAHLFSLWRQTYI